MRVLTAGGKTFFCDEVMVTDMVNPQKRGDKLVAKWLLDFIKCRLKDKIYVHCYAADGVYLLSDNSEVDPIDVRFNGRIKKPVIHIMRAGSHCRMNKCGTMHSRCLAGCNL